MAYEESLLNFLRKIRFLTRRFFTSENESFNFSNSVAKNIFDIISEYENKTNSLIEHHNAYIKLDENSIDTENKKYYETIESYKKLFKENIAVISDRQNKEVLKLKEKNENFSSLLLRDIEIIDTENQTINSSYEQKIDVILHEKDIEVDRLKYLVSFPLVHYSDFISTCNDNLERQNEAIHATSSKKLYNFDESNKSLLEHYAQTITNRDHEYSVKMAELSSKLAVIKENISNQTIRLNNRINQLSQTKNIEISEFKNIYNKALLSINESKEKIKNDYQAKSREVLKSFAQILTELDKDIDTLTVAYNKNKEKLMEKLKKESDDFNKKYDSLELKYKTQFENMEKNNTKAILYSEIKHKYRTEKKALLSRGKEIMFVHKNKIKELNKPYITELELIKKKKFIAEIDKNYQIEMLAINEAFEYEKLNFEKELEHKKCEVDTYNTNKRLSLSVSDLRCSTEVRNKLYQKDYSDTDLIYKEQCEILLNQKSLTELERNYAKEIETIVHSKSSYLQNLEQSLNNILSLLEIEKTKKLKEFNVRNYETLLLKNQLTYSYNESKYLHERDYYLKLNSLKTERIQNSLDNDLGLTNFEIEKKNNLEEHFHAKEKLLYLKKIGQEKYKLYSSRFKYELNQITKSYNSYTSLLNHFDSLLESIYSYLTKMSATNNINHDSYKNYVYNILLISESYSQELSYEFETIADKILNNRVSFETGFKYDSLFSDIKENHLNEIEKINNNREQIEKTIKNYQNEIMDYTARVFTLENDQTILLKEIENQKKQNKQSNIDTLNLRISQIKMQISDFEKKISHSEKFLEVLNSDLNKIPKKTKEENLKYTKEFQKISKEQRNESSVYYDTMSAINHLVTKYGIHANMPYESFFKEEKQNLDIMLFLNKYQRYRKINIDKLKSHFKIIDSIYVKQIENEHDKMLKRYILNYTTGLKTVDKQYKNKELDRLNRIDDFNNKFKKRQNENEAMITLAKYNYSQKLHEIKSLYDNSIYNTQNEALGNKARYFTEVLSVNCNMDYLVTNYNNDVFKYNSNYDKKFDSITSKYQNEKKALNKKCTDNILSYREEITNNGISLKFQTKQVREDNKSEKLLLNNEVKEKSLSINDLEKTQSYEIEAKKASIDKQLSDLEFSKNREISYLEKKHKMTVNNSIKTQIKLDLNQIQLKK